MRATLRTTILAAAAAVTLTACTAEGTGTAATTDGTTTDAATPATTGTDDGGTTVTLTDADGAEVGTAVLRKDGDAVAIDVDVADLEPGFHGFHLHAVGLCEPASPDPSDPAKVGDFLSAGGHLGADMADHGAHQGDLPSLLVDSTGSGRLTASTDAVTLEDLMDDDGTAVMVHAGPDNFANIPERYAPNGPDADTLKTGDSGDRIACGVVGG